MLFKGKCNIIFMRDDTDMSRMTIGPRLFKAIVFLVILGMVAAGASAYLGYRYYTQNRELEGIKATLQDRIAALESQIQKYRKVDTMFSTFDNEDLQDLAATMDLNSSTPMVVSVDLEEIFYSTDLNMVLVNNVQAAFHDQSMRLRFDINNLQTTGAVRGIPVFSVITREGIEIDIGDSGTPFEISRFKPFKLTLPLPGEIDREELFALRIKIKETSGQLIFSKTYPLAQILT